MSFFCEYSVFLTLFVEKIIYSPLNGLDILIKMYLTMYMDVRVGSQR